MFDSRTCEGARRRVPALRVLAAALTTALGIVPAIGANADGRGADVTGAAGPPIIVANCLADGPGSLRDAIEVLAKGADVAIVDASGLACSTISLSGAALRVPGGRISLIGPGSDALTISAAPGQRVIEQADGASYLAISGIAATGGQSEVSGGCIEAQGSLVLTDVAVRDCTVSGTTAVRGGGIHAAGNLQATRVRVLDNVAHSTTGSAQGGGIFAEAQVLIVDSTISGNRTMRDTTSKYGFSTGGGIVATDFAAIVSSTISGNDAATAAGIAVKDAVISSSTISGNRADTAAGISVEASLSLENSTIAFNCARDAATSPTPVGAGVQAVYGFSMQSSIVAGNGDCEPAPDGNASSAFDLVVVAGSVSGAANLVVVPQPSLQLPADTLIGIDPQLGPLADNGGPAWTHALPLGSAAIDAGDNPRHLAYDARGFGHPREQGLRTDIGAFEFDDAIFDDEFERVARSAPGGG